MEEKGIGELCGRIAEDSSREAAEIIRMAEEKAASRLAQAKIDADRAADDILQRAGRDSAVESRRTSSRLHLELRKMELQGREARIESVMQRVREEINSLRGTQEYPELLIRLIVDGALKLGEREMEIAVAAPDRKIFADAFMQRISEELSRAGISGPAVTLSPQPIAGTGVIVRGRSGKVEVNNTLEGRISHMGRELRMAIAKILFGEK
ncbi:MAG: V-type ATP synthase subunit E family protein [Candidatus Aureabacteria bacterium]|nr:V-type ATP synthase subunit E family protein [Candidatus Auribacterota bacterium]